MTAVVSPRAVAGGPTSLPIAADQFVDYDYNNANAVVIAAKTTATKVISTTDVDLLNGEFTLPANVLGTRGLARLWMYGDFLINNNSNSTPLPRFKFKMGSGPTTILDSGSVNNGGFFSATRGWWRTRIDILNLTAASQLVTIEGRIFWNASLYESSTFTVGVGAITVGQNSIPAFSSCEMFGGNKATIDTAADQLLQYTVALGTVTNEDWQLLGAVLEIV